VLYVLDGKAGLSAADEAAARELRRRGAPVLFVVNKLDSPRREAGAGEFYRLGASDLVQVSAELAAGTRIERTDAIMSRLEQMTQQLVPEAQPVALPVLSVIAMTEP